MASLPGGEMETLKTSIQESQRTRVQTGNEKKLKQVPTIIAHYQFTFLEILQIFCKLYGARQISLY